MTEPGDNKGPAPPWPERIELVEVGPATLNPGDTLVVSPKEGTPSIEALEQLKEFFDWLFPNNQVAIVGLPVSLDVVTPSDGGD